jgi:hypothetical protein
LLGQVSLPALASRAESGPAGVGRVVSQDAAGALARLTGAPGFDIVFFLCSFLAGRPPWRSNRNSGIDVVRKTFFNSNG